MGRLTLMFLLAVSPLLAVAFGDDCQYGLVVSNACRKEWEENFECPAPPGYESFEEFKAWVKEQIKDMGPAQRDLWFDNHPWVMKTLEECFRIKDLRNRECVSTNCKAFDENGSSIYPDFPSTDVSCVGGIQISDDIQYEHILGGTSAKGPDEQVRCAKAHYCRNTPVFDSSCDRGNCYGDDLGIVCYGGCRDESNLVDWEMCTSATLSPCGS